MIRHQGGPSQLLSRRMFESHQRMPGEIIWGRKGKRKRGKKDLDRKKTKENFQESK